MNADPLSVTCSFCDAVPGQRCMMFSDWARKPHAARKRLALALAAHADPALDAFFPPIGPCGLCGVKGLDQRHRVIDAIAEQLAAGEGPDVVAADYGLAPEALDAVAAWAERWPGVWL